MNSPNFPAIRYYDQLCGKFGEKIINSVIDYNLLHLRPTSHLSFDIPDHENPIVTAESPAALVAIRELVAKMEASGETGF